MKSQFVLAAMIAATALPSYGAEIVNGRGTKVRLGFGVNVDIEEEKDDCIEYDAKDTPEDARSANPHSSVFLEVSSSIITSSRQLDEFSGSSVSAGIQYMAIGVSGSNGNSSQDSMSSDQIAIGIRASSDYGRWYLTNARLKPKMAELAETDLEGFYRKCGHEYVSGYRRGQGLMVIIRTLSESSFHSSSSSTSVGGSVGIGVLSVGASTAFTSAASQMLKYGSLQVNLTEYGAGPLNTVSTIITTKKEVEEFAKKIEGFVHDLKPEDASLTSYMTSAYPIGKSTYNPVFADYKRNALWDMFSDYRKLRNDLLRLKDSVRTDLSAQYRDLCSFASEMSCADYATYLSKLLQQTQDGINSLSLAAAKCGKAQEDTRDCDTSDIWRVNPQLKLDITWPNQFRRTLYEARIRAIARRPIGGRGAMGHP